MSKILVTKLEGPVFKSPELWENLPTVLVYVCSCSCVRWDIETTESLEPHGPERLT